MLLRVRAFRPNADAGLTLPPGPQIFTKSRKNRFKGACELKNQKFDAPEAAGADFLAPEASGSDFGRHFGSFWHIFMIVGVFFEIVSLVCFLVFFDR